MTSDSNTPSIPIILACRKCGQELPWGEPLCQNCKTDVVCGLPLVADFPLGLALGVVFNVIKLVIVAVISFGFLISIPSRWYYPIYPRRARILIRPRGSSDGTDFEVFPSEWRKREPGQITTEYIVQNLYVNDRVKLHEAMKKQSENNPAWALSAIQFMSRLEAEIPAKK